MFWNGVKLVQNTSNARPTLYGLILARDYYINCLSEILELIINVIMIIWLSVKMQNVIAGSAQSILVSSSDATKNDKIYVRSNLQNYSEAYIE